MSRKQQTLTPDYFDGLYTADNDPWKFASSDYEQMKYAHTLASLPEVRYGNALEVGCSIGVLTVQLTTRCDRLLAVDAAASPLEDAKLRCSGMNSVKFARMFVPGEWPQGAFDLIVLSEVVYYLDAIDIRKLAERILETLSPGGAVILVHWTGETDYPLSGDEAVELLVDRLGEEFEIVRADRRPEYRLDILRRRSQAL